MRFMVRDVIVAVIFGISSSSFVCLCGGCDASPVCNLVT